MAPLIQRWRDMASAEGLSIRELVIRVIEPQTFIGRPATVAGVIATLVSDDAGDGLIVVPHDSPAGLDEFADKVVPLLQELRPVPHRLHRPNPARSPRSAYPVRAAGAFRELTSSRL